eukprot:577003-Pelagomonas_calceolata.AAC.2
MHACLRQFAACCSLAACARCCCRASGRWCIHIRSLRVTWVRTVKTSALLGREGTRWWWCSECKSKEGP